MLSPPAQIMSTAEAFKHVLKQLSDQASAVKEEVASVKDLVGGLERTMGEIKAANEKTIALMDNFPETSRLPSHDATAAEHQEVVDAMQGNLKRLVTFTKFISETNSLATTATKAAAAVNGYKTTMDAIAAELQALRSKGPPQPTVDPKEVAALKAELRASQERVRALTTDLTASKAIIATNAGQMSAVRVTVSEYVNSQATTLRRLAASVGSTTVPAAPAKTEEVSAPPNSSADLLLEAPEFDDKHGPSSLPIDSTVQAQSTAAKGGDGSDVDMETSSKPERAVQPPSPADLEVYNDIGEYLTALPKEFELGGSTIHFRNPVFMDKFGMPKIPAGLSNRVLKKAVQPETAKHIPQPPAFDAITLHLWNGLLLLPDNPTNATASEYVEQQGVYEYTKEDHLQTVRLWVMLILMHHFSDGRFITLLDQTTQTIHALTCPYYLMSFLDEMEGSPGRRDMELCYGTGDDFATAENWCKLCAPQFALQAMFCWANCTKEQKYNTSWQCMVNELDYVSVDSPTQHGPARGLFSTRLIERFVCRLPLFVSQAILSVCPVKSETATEFLDAMLAALVKAKYFSGRTPAGAMSLIRDVFGRFLKVKTTYLLEYPKAILQETRMMCSACNIGIFNAKEICCNPKCKAPYDEAKQAAAAALATLEREKRKARFVAVPIGQVGRRMVNKSKPVVKPEEGSQSTRSRTDIYGRALFTEAAISAAMKSSKYSVKNTGYYDYHQNRLEIHDKEISCFPRRPSEGAYWFGKNFITPDVNWHERADYFHYIAPVMAKMAITKYKWEMDWCKDFPPLDEKIRFPLVAYCMLQEMDPKLWKDFSYISTMRDLFLSDRYQPGYFDYYVQFTLVNRAIECIRDVLSHQPATPIFLVLLREEFRVYFGYRTGIDPMEFFPMWTPTLRYNHWNSFVHVLSTSRFGHAHARFLEALTDKRNSERILKKLNTWTKEEQKSYHLMISQL